MNVWGKYFLLKKGKYMKKTYCICFITFFSKVFDAYTQNRTYVEYGEHIYL